MWNVKKKKKIGKYFLEIMSDNIFQTLNWNSLRSHNHSSTSYIVLRVVLAFSSKLPFSSQQWNKTLYILSITFSLGINHFFLWYTRQLYLEFYKQFNCRLFPLISKYKRLKTYKYLKWRIWIINLFKRKKKLLKSRPELLVLKLASCRSSPYKTVFLLTIINKFLNYCSNCKWSRNFTFITWAKSYHS